MQNILIHVTTKKMSECGKGDNMKGKTKSRSCPADLLFLVSSMHRLLRTLQEGHSGQCHEFHIVIPDDWQPLVD